MGIATSEHLKAVFLNSAATSFPSNNESIGKHIEAVALDLGSEEEPYVLPCIILNLKHLKHLRISNCKALGNLVFLHLYSCQSFETPTAPLVLSSLKILLIGSVCNSSILSPTGKAVAPNLRAFTFEKLSATGINLVVTRT